MTDRVLRLVTLGYTSILAQPMFELRQPDNQKAAAETTGNYKLFPPRVNLQAPDPKYSNFWLHAIYKGLLTDQTISYVLQAKLCNQWEVLSMTKDQSRCQ